MPNQDLSLTIAAEDFNRFSDAIRAFNARTNAVNNSQKKCKYSPVMRIPTRANVAAKHVVVTLLIQDRSKVLWQELTEIVDRYKIKTFQKPAKAIPSPIQAPSRQWGIWVPCADEASARAAASFLQVVAKVGQPQVECRG